MYGTKGVTRALHSNARQFSTATRLQASGLKINSDRLWNTLHETCEWGAAHRYGEYVPISYTVTEHNLTT
jgi:hypothetical protein